MSSKTVILKKDWDSFPDLELRRGQHAIRKSEQRVLLDFILRSEQGAILISGKRGVGKTSAFFSADNMVKTAIPFCVEVFLSMFISVPYPERLVSEK